MKSFGCKLKKLIIDLKTKEQIMKKETIHEYDILRILVTMLVILGHCTYYQKISRYGGIDYTPCGGLNIAQTY